MRKTKKAAVVSKDGTKIAYERVGDGPIVIIVLGALNTRKSGAKLAKLLAAHFTVVSFDRRGRGDSTDTAPYSPQREVEDIEALIDAVGEPCSLYGHSSGAAIVLQAASQLGEKVRRIAIYEAPYALDDGSREAASKYFGELKQLLEKDCKGDAVALFVRSVGVSDKQIEAMKRMPMWRGLEALAPTLAYDSEVLGPGHALPISLLESIRIPTLVMHGGAGAPSMRDAAQAISTTIPGAQLCSLDGQTHGVQPDVMAPVLEEFFL